MPPSEGAIRTPLPQANELTPPPEPQPFTQAKTTNTYKTFRLSVGGLPARSSTQQVKELVRSALGCFDEHFSVRSIARHPVVQGKIMATLEFTAIPESLSGPSKESKHRFCVEGCDLVFDENFLGLTALTDPEEEWAIDIVAVSGLNSHPFGSFKTRGGNWMWLRDGLSQDVPGSRVLTYGLNTELVNSQSSENIIDLGKQCREALFSISSAINKPLVLVGHSLGGIILREAINLMRKGGKENKEDRDFLRTLAGILLFGVPSQGMAIEFLQPMVGDGPNRQLLESLSVDSAFLQNQSEIFLKTLTLPFVNLDIVSFYETRMSRTAKQDEATKQWSMTGPFAFLVDRHSATQGQVYGTKKHRVHPVPSSHVDIVKFEDQEDATYQVVLKELRGMLRFEPQPWRELERPEKACLRSLSFPDQATREVDIQPTPGTCEWLVNHPTYVTWLHNSCGLLWIRGNPGTGKSMAMKSLLQHARAALAPEDMVASFFIHGRGNSLQKSELGLYRSLSHQLYQRFPDEFSSLTAFFKKNVDTYGDPDAGKWEWSSQDLLEHLSRALDTISRRFSVVIFVDALDEAGETVALAIVDAFKSRLAAANEHPRLKICFSCRHYPQITLDGGITIVMEDHNGVDINCIADRQLQYSGFEEREKDQLKEVVRTRSQGIIQWATLVVSSVIRDRTHGNSLEEALKLVPKSLYELYASLLPTTPKIYCDEPTRKTRDQKLALKLFQWVLYARSPLSVWELQQTLALDYNVELRSTVEHQSGDDYIYWKDLHLKFKSLSQGLIEIKGDWKMGSVQFIHQSVVDFLLSSEKASDFLSGGSGLPPARLAHFQLSRSCLRYLFMEDVYDILRNSVPLKSLPGQPWKDDSGKVEEDRRATTLRCLSKLPFLLYAWQHWMFHLYYAQKASLHEFDGLEKVDLFEPSQRKKSDHQEKQLQRIYPYLGEAGSCSPDGLKFPWPEDNLLLCIFSFCGLLFHVQKLLDARPKELCKSILQHALLTVAIRGRQKAVAEELIQRNVGLDKERRFSSQLELVCEWGETDLVSMLLKRGWKSHRTSSSPTRRNPLGRAALAGHIDVIDVLLDAGANINAKDSGGRTVLHVVAEGQTSPHVARHLMERGADLSSQSFSGQTPLHEAAHYKNVLMINAILGHGSSSQVVQNNPAWFSIGRKTNRKKMEESKLLLINAIDNNGWTPFATAVRRNGFEAMEALFRKGSNIDVRDNDDVTPLMLACRYSDVGIANFLLGAGADVNVRGRNNVTCLMMACEGGNADMVRFLLKNGFQNVNAATSTGVTALWNAIQSFPRNDDISVQLVKELIKSGAEVNIKGRCGRTSLMKAAFWGRFQTCVLLLHEGAEVNVEDEMRRTALIHTVMGVRSRKGSFKHAELTQSQKEEEPKTVELLRLLLSSGAAATARDNYGKTALHYAHPQQKQIVRLLREVGLDGDLQSDVYLEDESDWR